MFCQNCAAEVSDIAVVCVKCGVATGYKAHSTPTEVGDMVGTIVGGFIFSALMPIVGIGISFYLFAKGKAEGGVGVLVSSIIFWIIWASVLM